MKRFTILFAWILILLTAGCSFLKTTKLIKAGHFSEAEFSETIPFKYAKNLIFVVIKIEDEPYNFIFDTGAEVGVVKPELLAKINYKKQGELKVSDSNKTSNKPGLLTINSVGIGNVIFKDMLVISQDLSAINFCGIEIHGIIGSNLMRKAIWRIDYQQEQIEFKSLGKQFPIAKDAFTIPMDCEKNGSAYLVLNVDGEELKGTFDTGSTGFIRHSKKDISSIALTKNTADIQGESVGIYGKHSTRIIKKKTATIDLGDMELNGKVINFVEKRASLIGNKLWDNFNVVIDWTNCQLHLEKTKEIEEETYKAFQYGFYFDKMKEEISINTHIKSHSLYQPIDSDNKIVSMDAFEINENLDFCNFLVNDYPTLRKKENLKLVVLEKGVKKEIMLKKELIIGDQ